MKTYTVTLEEITVYEIPIRAESKNDACKTALKEISSTGGSDHIKDNGIKVVEIQ